MNTFKFNIIPDFVCSDNSPDCLALSIYFLTTERSPLKEKSHVLLCLRGSKKEIALAFPFLIIKK